MKGSLPHLKFEQRLWSKGFLVAGIDEVGRGSFAGPLMVGVVVLKPIDYFNHSSIQRNECSSIQRNEYPNISNLLSLGINDSKLLSTNCRELIKKSAQEFILYSSIQSVSVDIINKKGVGFANKLGFKLAASTVAKKFKTGNLFYLTDAIKIPDVGISQQKNIIHGDATSITIALASILAKVRRDNFMKLQGSTFPLYGFEHNKGYGTAYHRKKIQEFGPCMLHRTTFIRNYVPRP